MLTKAQRKIKIRRRILQNLNDIQHVIKKVPISGFICRSCAEKVAKMFGMTYEAVDLYMHWHYCNKCGRINAVLQWRFYHKFYRSTKVEWAAREWPYSGNTYDKDTESESIS